MKKMPPKRTSVSTSRSRIFRAARYLLKDRVAVVPGGGSGIGKAIAACFASQGATVCILELNSESAKAAADAIREAGGKSTHFACDVSNQAATVDVMNKIASQFKKIDI